MRRALLMTLGLASACLTLDPFLFNNQDVERYGWDDDPCDPQLRGELTEAEHRLNGGPAPRCHPSVVPPEQRVEDFVTLADGRRIHYVFAHHDDAEATIFYSHGTSRHLGRYWDRVELMWSMGYNVMVYDYPGYGRSDGEPDEAGVYAAAVAVFEDVLPQMPGVDTSRVFLLGYSLGGGPTYELALRASEGTLSTVPRGVVSEAAFCSIEALVRDGSRLDLPGTFLADHALDNCAKIARLDPRMPVMIMHGNADSFIVPTHADLLLDAAAGDVEYVEIDGADHTEVPTVMGDDYE
ncbi:MAG: alpha/beta fold hydrolase [Deltaproteobacteria bacterium]|nr:alpha/beta fold hydrolase [Deltaproteobacteria bacterium]